MLAQAQGAVDALAVAVAALLVAVMPIAMFCTKVTDFVRNAFDKNDSLPKAVWNVVPIVAGVGLCLGFQLNAVENLAKSIPALAASTALAGVAGQVLTGLLMGTFAGYWHDKMSSWGGKALARPVERLNP
jgi:hypothetical protein